MNSFTLSTLATPISDLPLEYMLSKAARPNIPSSKFGRPEQPYAYGHGIRYWQNSDHGRGYIDIVFLSHGLRATIANCMFHDDMPTTWLGDDRLKVHFKISGDTFMFSKGDENISYKGNSCALLLHSGEQMKGDTLRRWVQETSLTLSCDRLLLKNVLSDDQVMKLPQKLQNYLAGTATGLFYTPITFTTDMYNMALDVLSTPYLGEERNRYIESQSLLLLQLVLAQWAANTQEDNGGLPLNVQDVRKLQHIREILEANFTNPPTLAALGREVGLNRTKLAYGFKKLFNTTIHAYVQELRMKRAIELLQQQQLSVAQVADILGYDYPGNFSIAFKKYYGISPLSLKNNALHLISDASCSAS